MDKKIDEVQDFRRRTEGAHVIRSRIAIEAFELYFTS
jgi:hypothetical protein